MRKFLGRFDARLKKRIRGWFDAFCVFGGMFLIFARLPFLGAILFCIPLVLDRKILKERRAAKKDLKELKYPVGINHLLEVVLRRTKSMEEDDPDRRAMLFLVEKIGDINERNQMLQQQYAGLAAIVQGVSSELKSRDQSGGRSSILAD